MENNLISDNVIEHSRIPLFEEKKFEPAIYTPEQIKILLEYAESTNSDVCLYFYSWKCLPVQEKVNYWD